MKTPVALAALAVAFCCSIVLLAPAAGPGDAPANVEQRLADLDRRVGELERANAMMHRELAHTQLMALAADTEIRLLPPPPPLEAALARLTAQPKVQVDHASAQALVDSMARIGRVQDLAATYLLLAPQRRDFIRRFDRVSLQAWVNYYGAIERILRRHHDQARRIDLSFWVGLTLYADTMLRVIGPGGPFKVTATEAAGPDRLRVNVADTRSGRTFTLLLATDQGGKVYQPMPPALGGKPEQVMQVMEYMRDFFGGLARELDDGTITAANFDKELTARTTRFREKMKALQGAGGE